MVVLAFIGLFVASLAMFYYGAERYDQKRTNWQIAKAVWDEVTGPFVSAYKWCCGFVRGGYRLFFRNDPPYRTEVDNSGEAAFEIVAMVASAIGMAVGVIGTLISLGVAIVESIITK